MPKPIKNIGASVRARLLALARQRNQPFDLLLTRYTLERLLFRLSLSRYRDRFVLKGAVLLTGTMNDPQRPTRDLELLGFGDPDPDGLVTTFREICAIKSDDAVVFDAAAVTIDRIREDTEYGGLRIKTTAAVDGARIRVIVDIGFGDAMVPGPVEIDLPILLDQSTLHLRAYPYESVIAEKLHAMVYLGRANTRLKDFYDVWRLARLHKFEDERLSQAIAATFGRRATEVPHTTPDALTDAFANDPTKQRQWRAFIRDFAIDPVPLERVVSELVDFLMPHVARARTQ